MFYSDKTRVSSQKDTSFKSIVVLFICLLLLTPRILYSSEISSVQVGAFSLRENAQILVKGLKNHGITCTVHEIRGLYKVYCGELSQKSDANTLREKLFTLGHKEAFIVSNANYSSQDATTQENSTGQSLLQEVLVSFTEKTDEESMRTSQEEVTRTTGIDDRIKAKEMIKTPTKRAAPKEVAVAKDEDTKLEERKPPPAEETQWSVQIEPMWMDVEGNDIHVGDIFKYREEWVGSTLLYGTTYKPIRLNMDDGIALRADVIYRKNQWGLGLSGWWFDTKASQSGRVTTPPEVLTATGFIYYEYGVRMWDNTITPVDNELEPSLFSPVNYWARNELGIWTVDLYGIRTLAEKEASSIDMTFGLKLGSLDIDREEGQKQRAFVYDYYGAGFHLDNHITLESSSKADYGMMGGPTIGLQGKAQYKQLGIEGFINQSLLIGRVRYSGIWTDVDDIWVVTGPVGGPFTPFSQDAYLEGRFSFSKRETITLPVTEAKLKFLYDVIGNVSIGVGGFASIWWDAPVAPKWSIPGAWTWDEGTGWRLQEDTLIFYGLTVALNYRF